LRDEGGEKRSHLLPGKGVDESSRVRGEEPLFTRRREKRKKGRCFSFCKKKILFRGNQSRSRASRGTGGGEEGALHCFPEKKAERIERVHRASGSEKEGPGCSVSQRSIICQEHAVSARPVIWGKKRGGDLLLTQTHLPLLLNPPYSLLIGRKHSPASRGYLLKENHSRFAGGKGKKGRGDFLPWGGGHLNIFLRRLQMKKPSSGGEKKKGKFLSSKKTARSQHQCSPRESLLTSEGS